MRYNCTIVSLNLYNLKRRLNKMDLFKKILAEVIKKATDSEVMIIFHKG